jgi:glutamate/aspartate transport system substrate-binding protein
MNTRTAAALFALAAALCFPSAETAVAEDYLPRDMVGTADESTGTLEKARMRGAIIIGYRLASIPFSYRNSTHQPTGYAKELCDRVVDAIRNEFNLPQLKTIYQLIPASSERISMLQNGAIDLECSTTSVTPEREKIVDFSIPYFISNARLLTRKAYRIRNLRDLANKTIVFTTGTTAERIITEKLDVVHNKIAVLHGKTHADSFMMIKTGRAAAYVIDDILLAGLVSSARDPNAYEIIGSPLSSEYYAIMMRKEGGPLKAAVNKALADIIVSGEIKELYERWFMRPIPPSGAIMNLPMNPELTQFFARMSYAYSRRDPAQSVRP